MIQYSSMQSTWDALRVPSTRTLINTSTLVWYILPHAVSSFVMAVLAITPDSRAARVALWPIVALLALRAIASVDVSLGKPEGKIPHALFVVTVLVNTARTLNWALQKEHLVRHLRPENSSPSIIMDALDLTTNVRGYGWNWSHRLYIPPETRPKNRIAFVFWTFLSAVVHVFLWGIAHQAILSFSGVGLTAKEPVIFDDTLPFFLRYLRVDIMTAFAGLIAYAGLQIYYDLGTIVGVVFLRQDPAQWPPAFDAPWRATSLSDFWGRRWHQWVRHFFLFLGGYPLSFFLGRTGIVLGAFLASAVLHDIYMLALDSKAKGWGVFTAFAMMAPGVLAERTFYRLTGKRVGGVAGWVWTMAWLLTWNSLMLDEFAKVVLVGDSIPFQGVVPLSALVERVVTDFDAWLHTH